VIRKGFLVQEVKIGDTVLLHLPDGSAATRMVVNVISSIEVQLVNFEISGSAFNAITAPIYRRGTQPGQWEPTNEEPQEEFKIFVGEALRMADHPTMRMLHSLLNIKLSADIEEVFSMISRMYADKDLSSPFYEVQHRSDSFNDADYFYNLFTMGVQEGLRSTLYFLQRFLSLAETVRAAGAAVVAEVKPSNSGSLGINPGVLNAEYEAFMLLSRATLDRLNYALKYYFQIKNKKISNLYQLETELVKAYSGDKHAQGLIKVLDKHASNVSIHFASQDQSTERNRMAHQEFVGFATPNIMYNPDGVIRVVLIYKGDLQADATEELTDRFNKLKLFIIDILNEFFTISQKRSVYETSTT
jgi:hypothetical protein